MSKQKSAVEVTWKKVGNLVADRERLIEKIGTLEREQATASVERLEQIAVEVGAARAALPPLDGQIEAARREVAAAQLVERQAQIAEWQRKDAEIDVEIVPRAKALLESFERKRAVTHELHALGANGRGVPLGLWDALTRYVALQERPPEPAPEQSRTVDLRNSIARWRRLRAEVKQVGTDSGAVGTRIAELDALIKRDEAALRALGEQPPKDEQPVSTSPIPGDQMTPDQRRIFDDMRRQIAEVQGG